MVLEHSLLFWLQEDADAEYHKKQEENEAMADEKTVKKRAKRFESFSDSWAAEKDINEQLTV